MIFNKQINYLKSRKNPINYRNQRIDLIILKKILIRINPTTINLIFWQKQEILLIMEKIMI